FRVDRRRKMPVTILLKAIGMTPESILATFFDFDQVEIHSEGGMLEFVPERWKGEMARFDITDRDGNVIVEKYKRINAKHIRDLTNAGVQRISVPVDFLVGRVLAKNIVNPETGEVIANANDEITETMLSDIRAANIREIQTLYINDLDRGSYISATPR